MRFRIVTSLFFLLAAAGMLSGCGDTIAFTYRGDESAWKTARDAGRAALAKRDYQAAEAEFSKAVESARRMETTNPHHLAETLSDLAATYQKEGKTKEAMSTYQEVINVVDKVGANKNSSLMFKRVASYNQIMAWLNIGNIYKEQKDYKRAEAAYKMGLQVDAYKNGINSAGAELKKAYGDLLDKTGQDPVLAKRMHEEAASSSDEILEGL